jgi:hypothetical protein
MLAYQRRGKKGNIGGGWGMVWYSFRPIYIRKLVHNYYPFIDSLHSPLSFYLLVFFLTFYVRSEHFPRPLVSSPLLFSFPILPLSLPISLPFFPILFQVLSSKYYCIKRIFTSCEAAGRAFFRQTNPSQFVCGGFSNSLSRIPRIAGYTSVYCSSYFWEIKSIIIHGSLQDNLGLAEF